MKASAIVRWNRTHFLAGVFALWILWLGFAALVAVELGQRGANAHAEGVLRSIPFHTDYAEEVKLCVTGRK